MEKISAVQAQTLLKRAAHNLRAVVSKNKELEEKIAGMERAARIRGIVAEMEDKGLNDELSTEEKVAALHGKDLDVIEEAVKLASPQRGKIGEAGEKPGDGVHPFVAYIATGEDDS